MSAPRIAPLPTDEWSTDAVAALRDAFGAEGAERLLSGAPDVPRMPNVLATLMRHPARRAVPHIQQRAPSHADARAASGASSQSCVSRGVHGRSTSGRSTCAWPDCVGITTAEIDAVGRGVDAGIWSALEADLVAAADQLLDRYRIDDETYARLAEHLDEPQLIELTFVVGTYTCLAMAFNSLGLALDPELDPAAAPPLPEGGAAQR